jgi:hypothetical protein
MKGTLILVLATVAAAITIATAAGATGAATAQSFGVTSSLDGKSVLPLRIHWIGRPQVVLSKVKELDFLIDGRLGWVEHKTPFVYGDDGNWLVTSFLKPGKHTFAIRMITTDGAKSTDTVHARVVAAPAPPTALTGTTWQRTITAEEANKQTSGHRPPTGLWKIKIGPRGWLLSGPPHTGGLLVDVAYLTATKVQMRPNIETPPFQNPFSGGFCDDTDPLWTWTVAVSTDGNTMSLNPAGHDRCGDRAAILQGTWTRFD